MLRGRLARNGIALASCFVVSAGSIAAQSDNGAAAATTAGFPVVRAVRVERGPEIDGIVVGDPAWADVPAAGGFRQTTPDEGEEASE